MRKYIKQAVAAISLSIVIMGAQGVPLLAAAEQSSSSFRGNRQTANNQEGPKGEPSGIGRGRKTV